MEYSKEEWDKKLQVLLTEFQDPFNRYRMDPIFNKVINGLMHGAEPPKLIDSLIEVINNQHEALTDYVKNYAPPHVVASWKKEEELWMEADKERQALKACLSKIMQWVNSHPRKATIVQSLINEANNLIR